MANPTMTNQDAEMKLIQIEDNFKMELTPALQEIFTEIVNLEIINAYAALTPKGYEERDLRLNNLEKLITSV